MKQELKDLRKRIYQNLKRKAYSYEGSVSNELKAYRKDQAIQSRRAFSSSDIEELKESVKRSDVIYLGDFHTFDQNIRNVLRILKVVVSNQRECLIGLEMVDANYQICLDAYMEGHLTELEFLESVHYHDSWRFPWSHYKLIFELAKANNIKMIALNTKGNLKERDRFAAEKISEALRLNKGAQLLVVYGELHINRDKIPALLQEKNPAASQTIIHQNLDEVYWRMSEESQSDKIVKFNEREFCVNSAPPWVKYESMIYWYENLTNDPDFDIHEYIIENGKKIFSDDTQENFLNIIMEATATARIDLDQDELENFNLHDHTGLEFIQEKITNLRDPGLINFYNNLIATGQSFRLPQESVFYCSSYSMNRISYLAGIHIFHCALRASGFCPADIILNKQRESFYVLFAMERMYAFFFSKIMNPHRKCDMYWNLNQELALESSKSRQNILSSAVGLLDGAEIKEAIFNLNLNEIHQLALITGHILGEYLYVKIFHLPETLELQKDFLSERVDQAGFKKIRGLLLSNLEYQKHKKRYF